jgi:transcriptional regulator with XRE-family HTH domain
MHDEITIGARLRALRRWRGMTLAELAGLAGLSKSFLSMAERGQRALDRRSHIAALANALRVSETDLVGGPHLSADPVQSDPHLRVPALRVALQTNRLGHAIVDRARPLPELVDAVKGLELLRRTCDYAQMGDRIPDLLDELHYHVATPADEAAQRVALTTVVDACYDAAFLTKNLNYADLGWSAAQVGLAAAEMADDPVLIGKAMFPIVLNTPREGGWRRTLAIAERAIDALEPHVGSGRGGSEVLGMAALNAALAAAALNDYARCQEWISEAYALAARVPDDPVHAWAYFSATNVAIWDISVRVECGQSGDVFLGLAEQVQEAKLAQLPTRRACFLADVGRGLARDTRSRNAAVAWLQRAEKTAPQRIRNDAKVRESIAVMLEQARAAALGRELRGMAARMGVPH